MMRKEFVSKITVDLNERESGVFCYTDNAAMGVDLSRGKGWYGGNGRESGQVEVISFTVGDEVYSFPMTARIDIIRSREQYREIQDNKLRVAALAKLSDKEKKLLGLA